MEAKVIKTGEIIYDAIEFETSDSFDVKGRTKNGRFIRYHADEVIMLPSDTQIKEEFKGECGHLTTINVIDWEQRRYETAKEVLKTFLSNECIVASLAEKAGKEKFHQDYYFALTAKNFADQLIAQLRGDGKE